jgi:azurin
MIEVSKKKRNMIEENKIQIGKKGERYTHTQVEYNNDNNRVVYNNYVVADVVDMVVVDIDIVDCGYDN